MVDRWPASTVQAFQIVDHDKFASASLSTPHDRPGYLAASHSGGTMKLSFLRRR